MTDDLILELMINAEENGYPQWGIPPKHVAEDMFDATDVSDFYTLEELTEKINVIQLSRKG